jgi:hypothetical protein
MKYGDVTFSRYIMTQVPPVTPIPPVWKMAALVSPIEIYDYSAKEIS